MVLYCLAYNNYYNRQVKKEDALDGYLPFLLSDPIQGVNFNPNDGVNTVQVINWNIEQLPNYIVCVDNSGNIHSRWFVLDAPRLRNGQYNLALRRDLFVDYYDPIITAPCFIEKATVDDSDPAIYNSENMTFNQIKTSETLLKDRTNCPWIVGYFARTSGDAEGTITTLTGTTKKDFPVDIVLPGDITTWEYYNYTTNNFKSFPTEILYKINYMDYFLPGPQKFTIKQFQITQSSSNIKIGSFEGYDLDNYPLKAGWGYNPLPTTFEVQSKIPFSRMQKDIIEYRGLQSKIDTSVFLRLQGKIIQAFDGTANKYYRIELEKTELINDEFTGKDSQIYQTMKNAFDIETLGPDDHTFEFQVKYYTYRIKLVEDSNLQTSYNIQTSRYHLNDAPYDMFAIPYGDNLLIKNTGAENWTDFTSSSELAFSTAMSIAQKYQGAGLLYDIQLLPYCPVRNIIVEDNIVDLQNDNLSYSVIEQAGNTVGIILNVSNSSFSFNIPLENPIEITNKKEQALCDMYRLCSPNYNGLFEFNVAENDGLNSFNVDCTYIPFNPYIHMNPDFKNLYGADFDDSRGLIVGGDFSLPVVTDQWETYKLNNKNYEQIFNRQIQNMEVNNAIQREREIWGAVAGGINAGTQGAMTGALVGGPIGAIVGGLIGGATSGIAGARDVTLNDRARAEALDYTKDQFGYQLGNIRALPDAIAKTTAYTKNNKIFPFLEFYTCTDVEKKALANKIKFNGMTVMRIGTIKEFIQVEPSYIKGQLIRIENFEEDFHILNEIANEVNKGVFV